MDEIDAYAELHCHSYFSLLAASSSPEELVERAAQLGLTGLAMTDTGSLAGAIRFDQACKKHAVRGIIGATVNILAEGAGDEGFELVLLAENQTGYANLSQALTLGLGGTVGGVQPQRRQHGVVEGAGGPRVVPLVGLGPSGGADHEAGAASARASPRTAMASRTSSAEVVNGGTRWIRLKLAKGSIPRRLPPAVAAIYWFARTADDFADQGDWLMGEDVTKNGLGFRDMATPSTHGDPDTYCARYTGTSDSGGVHSNSAISNRAFYLVATQIGIPAATDIFYKAYTKLTDTNATFLKARAATEAQAVMDRLAAVGVDYDDVIATLEQEGVEKFEASWAELLDTVSGQLKAAGEGTSA